ncbi:TPA: hypothetical protein ACGQRM_004923, partial [Escherichia coli]
RVISPGASTVLIISTPLLATKPSGVFLLSRAQVPPASFPFRAAQVSGLTPAPPPDKGHIQFFTCNTCGTGESS